MALVAMSLVILVTGPFTAANAQDSPEAEPTTASVGDPVPEGDFGVVDVFEVSGFLDPVLAQGIEDAINRANADNARALVLQVNSTQAVVDNDRLRELADLMQSSRVPIHVWVGPSGARVAGRVGQLVGLADSYRVSAGSKIGPLGDQVLDESQYPDSWNAQAALLRTTELNWEQVLDQSLTPCDPEELTASAGRELTAEEAQVLCSTPTIGDFLVNLDAFESRIVTGENGEIRREPLTQARFRSLSLLEEQMHTVASPPVAYLMLVIGLTLLIFEFFSVGVGIAGVIGAVLTVLGAYGIAVLPVRTWALVLILLGLLAYAIDVQTAVPQSWTVIGTILLAIGTIFLYPESDVGMSWIPMLVAIGGVLIVMARGMPIMIRGRFSTTAIDRHYLVDKEGTVVEPLSTSQTTVKIDDGLWQARTTGLDVGTAVRVTASDERLIDITAI